MEKPAGRCRHPIHIWQVSNRRRGDGGTEGRPGISPQANEVAAEGEDARREALHSSLQESWNAPRGASGKDTAFGHSDARARGGVPAILR